MFKEEKKITLIFLSFWFKIIGKFRVMTQLATVKSEASFNLEEKTKVEKKLKEAVERADAVAQQAEAAE